MRGEYQYKGKLIHNSRKSHGSMLSLAQNALMTGAWRIILAPGIFLVVFVMCLTDVIKNAV